MNKYDTKNMKKINKSEIENITAYEQKIFAKTF